MILRGSEGNGNFIGVNEEAPRYLESTASIGSKPHYIKPGGPSLRSGRLAVEGKREKNGSKKRRKGQRFLLPFFCIPT